jgi:hypothetical protein
VTRQSASFATTTVRNACFDIHRVISMLYSCFYCCATIIYCYVTILCYCYVTMLLLFRHEILDEVVCLPQSAEKRAVGSCVSPINSIANTNLPNYAAALFKSWLSNTKEYILYHIYYFCYFLLFTSIFFINILGTVSNFFVSSIL